MEFFMHKNLAPDVKKVNYRDSFTIWLLLAVLVIALVFRTQSIKEMSYWFDESFCLKMAEFPVLDLVVQAKEDPHPPFFYFVLKSWVLLFGSSTLVARQMSLIPGMFGVVGIFLLVREAYRDQKSGSCSNSVNMAAVMAASLVALSPLHILWSYQVRMYALGTCLAAFSSLFLLRALFRDQPRKRDWCFFTLTAITLAYTHNFGLFTVTAQYLFAVGYLLVHRQTDTDSKWNRQFRPLVISAVCTGLAWLPWLPSFLHQRQLVIEGFWTEPFSWGIVGITFFELFGLDQTLALNSTIGLIIGQISLISLLILALGRRPGDIFLALAAGLPFAIGILVSALSRNILNDRYFMFGQIFLLATFAVLTSRIPIRFIRYCVFLLCVGGTGYLAFQQWEKRADDASLPSIKGAMESIDSRRKANELLIVCDPSIYVSVIAHTKNRNNIFTFHPGQDYPFTHGAAAMRDDEYLNANDIAKRSDPWIWAFDADSYGWTVPIPEGCKLVGENRFRGLRKGNFVVRLYARTIPETTPVK